MMMMLMMIMIIIIILLLYYYYIIIIVVWFVSELAWILNLTSKAHHYATICHHSADHCDCLNGLAQVSETDQT